MRSSSENEILLQFDSTGQKSILIQVLDAFAHLGGFFYFIRVIVGLMVTCVNKKLYIK